MKERKIYEEGFEWATGFFQRLPNEGIAKRLFVTVGMGYAYDEYTKGNKKKADEIISALLENESLDDEAKEEIRNQVFGESVAEVGAEEAREPEFVAYATAKSDWVVEWLIPALKWTLFLSTWAFVAFRWLIYWTIFLSIELFDAISENFAGHSTNSKIGNKVIEICFNLLNFVLGLAQVVINYFAEKGIGALVTWEYKRMYGGAGRPAFETEEMTEA